MTEEIHRLTWPFSGTFDGQNFQEIIASPMLKEERILITVKTSNNELQVADIAFPASKQTAKQFKKLVKAELIDKLTVLV
jgi:hypothetical protein